MTPHDHLTPSENLGEYRDDRSRLHRHRRLFRGCQPRLHRRQPSESHHTIACSIVQSATRSAQVQQIRELSATFSAKDAEQLDLLSSHTRKIVRRGTCFVRKSKEKEVRTRDGPPLMRSVADRADGRHDIIVHTERGRTQQDLQANHFTPGRLSRG